MFDAECDGIGNVTVVIMVVAEMFLGSGTHKRYATSKLFTCRFHQSGNRMLWHTVVKLRK
jgi:hypothetical protein